MKITVSSPRLGTYLTLGLGAGLLGSSGSDAAVTVTVFGPDAQTSPATPSGINIGLYENNGYANNVFTDYDARFAFAGGKYFTQGADLGLNNWGLGHYSTNGSAVFGAILNSDQNFANISFNGDDGAYEAVGQFYFDGAGGGYLVALAVSTEATLSISSGKAAIVPEPSSIALLSLGAAGILARRRRIG